MLPVLDRFLLKELLYNVAFTLAVITSIFITASAVKLMHNYPDLDLLIIFRLLPFFLLHHLEFVLPLSLLISVVLVYGRAAASNEITTVKASGIHPYRLLLPALFVASLIAALSVYASNEWSPHADLRFRAMLASSKNIKDLFEKTIDKEARQVEVGEITLIWKRESFPEQGGVLLEDVHIKVDRTEDGTKPMTEGKIPFELIHAPEVHIQFDAKGNRVVFDLPTLVQMEGRLRGQVMKDQRLSLSTGSARWSKKLKYLTGFELWANHLRAADMQHPYRSSQELVAKMHERLALSLSSIMFVLIGVPLAMVFRAGSRLVAFLLSFLIVLFVFYPSHLLAQTLGDEKLVHPIAAAWSGCALLFVLGSGLLIFVVRR